MKKIIWKLKIYGTNYFNFRVKDHVELGELLNNSLSFDKGVDLAKSRFSVIKK